MVTLSLCVDLISLKIACDFVMNSVHYSKNTSSATSPLVGAHKFQSLGRLHFTDKKYFLRMLRRAQKH